MADENKPLKYMRYAIGEIVLVVVGILIALWINSTYQDYKNEEITKIYLNDFKRDLKADSILLAERIKANDVMIQSIDSILYMVNTKTEFSSADLQTFTVYNFNIMFIFINKLPTNVIFIQFQYKGIKCSTIYFIFIEVIIKKVTFLIFVECISYIFEF